MKTLPEYRELILGWARDRNLIEGATPQTQLDKLFEEVGEFGGAAARKAVPGKRDEMIAKMKDGLGDIFVVVTILAEQLGLEPNFAELEGLDDDASNSMLYLCAGCIAGVVLNYDIEPNFPPEEPVWHFNSAIAVAKAVAEENGFDFLECVAMAWDEIKDRKGRMIDGVFVKESDL